MTLCLYSYLHYVLFILMLCALANFLQNTDCNDVTTSWGIKKKKHDTYLLHSRTSILGLQRETSDGYMNLEQAYQTRVCFSENLFWPIGSGRIIKGWKAGLIYHGSCAENVITSRPIMINA
jgi:hypothetical protein